MLIFFSLSLRLATIHICCNVFIYIVFFFLLSFNLVTKAFLISSGDKHQTDDFEFVGVTKLESSVGYIFIIKVAEGHTYERKSLIAPGPYSLPSLANGELVCYQI